MSAPPPSPPADAAQHDAPDVDRRAAWPDTTQVGVFGDSRNPAGQAEQKAAPAATAVVFDVCHVGMVLRAVLFVEAVLALGILFVAQDEADFGLRLALGSVMALPAVLLWLSLTCLSRSQLARLGSTWQWMAAALLGALCGGFGWGLMAWAGQGQIGIVPWPAPAASGAFLAGLLTVWLQLRMRALLPADTTARLAELQSRIRPHFLFNTLNSALGLVRRDPQRAETLLEDLSELFRVALASEDSVASLGEEIELARRYLAIEQIRYGKRLQVVWQLEPRAAAARVPPLLLQPLVENAVRHGVEPDAEGGVIRISTRVRHGQAWLSITNTLPAVARAAKAAGHGIALQNVRERLHLMHDLAGRFEIEADAQKFRVQLAVPLDGAAAGSSPGAILR